MLSARMSIWGGVVRVGGAVRLEGWRRRDFGPHRPRRARELSRSAEAARAGSLSRLRGLTLHACDRANGFDLFTTISG